MSGHCLPPWSRTLRLAPSRVAGHRKPVGDAIPGSEASPAGTRQRPVMRAIVSRPRRGVRVGLRSATGNRVLVERRVAGSNPALSAFSAGNRKICGGVHFGRVAAPAEVGRGAQSRAPRASSWLTAPRSLRAMPVRVMARRQGARTIVYARLRRFFPCGFLLTSTLSSSRPRS